MTAAIILTYFHRRFDSFTIYDILIKIQSLLYKTHAIFFIKIWYTKIKLLMRCLKFYAYKTRRNWVRSCVCATKITPSISPKESLQNDQKGILPEFGNRKICIREKRIFFGCNIFIHSLV